MTKILLAALLVSTSAMSFASEEDDFSVRCLAEVRDLGAKIRAHSKSVQDLTLDSIDTNNYIKSLGNSLKGQSNRLVGTIGWSIYDNGLTAEKNTAIFSKRIEANEEAVQGALTILEDCLYAN